LSEVRTVSSLALLYAFRMLGLFMVLPVLMLYGGKYDGASPASLGLALGIYGLTQALFQIPLGLLSDIVGRKPVIIVGLVIFAAGSILAGEANSVEALIIGRALQGSGAIAAVIMAMVADLTSEESRTKAMAGIGASIGLSFSVAMVLGPAIAASGGLEAIFRTAAGLSLLGIVIVVFVVPTPVRSNKHREVGVSPQLFSQALANPELLRLNFGIFCLHGILMASFVAVPGLLSEVLHMSPADHWLFYLPVLSLAFVAMLPAIIVAEKKRKVKPVFVGAVALLSISCGVLALGVKSALFVITPVFLFFVAFNLLEATLPSMVSKVSPAGIKGTAMGVYSTSQFLGAFAGGVMGGWVLHSQSLSAIFVLAAGVALLWLVVALGMSPPKHLKSLCIKVTPSFDKASIAAIPGIEDASHVAEESILYLKVDPARFDPSLVQELSLDSTTS